MLQLKVSGSVLIFVENRHFFFKLIVFTVSKHYYMTLIPPQLLTLAMGLVIHIGVGIVYLHVA